jgi:hypothetical protein
MSLTRGATETTMKAVFLIGVLMCTALSSATALADGTSASSKATCLDAVSKSQELRDKHKLVEAREQLRVCAAAQCPTAIRSDCANWLAEVEKALPTVVFAAKDASGADLSTVKITMDGSVLTDHLEGVALPVDPGEHTFMFEAAGQVPLEKKLIIQEAQKDRHESITLTAAPAMSPSPVPGRALLAAPPDANAGGGLGTQKIFAIVAGGIGVAGLAVGTIFAVMDISKRNHAEAICPGTLCSQAGLDAWSDVATTQTFSTVGFIVGGVGVAGAAVLWFTAPRSNGGASAQVSFGPGSLQVKGSW